MASWLASKVGGAFNKDKNKQQGLSREARQLIEQAFQGFDAGTPVTDYHMNLMGKGANSSGSYVHQDTINTWRHPMRAMKFKVLESAAGITDPANWDAQYVERMISLVREIRPYPWGRQFLLALDQYHDREGNPVPLNTAAYTPNDYLANVVRQYPDEFVPCVSIHPYRKDAVQELQKWINLGVRMVKWIPTSQGIDLSDRRCKEFYNVMSSNGVALLYNCGPDDFPDPPLVDNTLGNPLLLRSALNLGVKVIVANCASEGKSLDSDQPIPHPLTNNLDLFLRMMSESQYDGLLFGDISGITTFGRIDCILPLLNHPELHPRLVYGSDYPTPAVNLVVQTYWFANRGFITEDESLWLGEIYKYNPLLFDFVLKRTLRAPRTGNKFDIRIFKENHKLRLPPIVTPKATSIVTKEKDVPVPNVPTEPVQNAQNVPPSPPIFGTGSEGVAIASTSSASEMSGEVVEENEETDDEIDAKIFDYAKNRGSNNSPTAPEVYPQPFDEEDDVEDVAL